MDCSKAISRNFCSWQMAKKNRWWNVASEIHKLWEQWQDVLTLYVERDGRWQKIEEMRFFEETGK